LSDFVFHAGIEDVPPAHAQAILHKPAAVSKPAAVFTSARQLDLSSKHSAEKLVEMTQAVLENAAAQGPPNKLLQQDGTWPLCKTSACKTNGKFALYAEIPNKKARFCFKCKASTHFDYCSQLYNHLLANSDSYNKYSVDKMDALQVEILQPLYQKRKR
jgi:hypothetical protein